VLGGVGREVEEGCGDWGGGGRGMCIGMHCILVGWEGDVSEGDMHQSGMTYTFWNVQGVTVAPSLPVPLALPWPHLLMYTPCLLPPRWA
jgi:hypothetical protein